MNPTEPTPPMSSRKYHPPVHLTRRQVIWAMTGVLLFDFVWVRMLFPWLMSARSDLGFAAGLVGSFALVAAHVDLVWSFFDPKAEAPPADPRETYRCDFCGTETKMSLFPAGLTPPAWSEYRSFDGRLRACGASACRVSFARKLSEKLTTERV